MNMGDPGKINREKLARLARSSGISREELDRKLEELGLQNVRYSTGGNPVTSR